MVKKAIDVTNESNVVPYNLIPAVAGNTVDIAVINSGSKQVLLLNIPCSLKQDIFQANRLPSNNRSGCCGPQSGKYVYMQNP